MGEVLGILATFIVGLGITSAVGHVLEAKQRASHAVDENADVRAGIIVVTASGFVIGKARPEHTLDLAENLAVASRDM